MTALSPSTSNLWSAPSDTWRKATTGLWRRPLSPTQLFSGACLLLYVAAGLWIRFGLDYTIGDALSRSATARAVVFSADPKATAVGFVWLPLPALAQIPFVIMLEPFGWAEFAGPLSTACWAALTVALLIRVGRRLGLSTYLTMVFVALYALNPLIIFQAANGMSEAMFYLVLVWALSGLLDWMDTPGPRPELQVGFALAAAMAIRYESLFLTMAIAVLMGLRRSTWTARLVTAGVVALPAFYVFIVWLAANRLIMGDALFWKHGLDVTGKPPTDAAWLPAATFRAGMAYSLGRTAMVAPGLLILPVFLVRRRETRTVGMTIVAAGSVFAIFTGLLVGRGASWGNLRYYTPAVTVVAVLVLWLATRWRSPGARTGLWLVLALGAVSGAAAANNRLASAPEHDWQVFAPALGLSTALDDAATTEEVSGLNAQRWRMVARSIDQRLADDPELRVVIDMGEAFPVFLMTDYPARYLIDSDRDYEARAATGFIGFDLAYGTAESTGRFVEGIGHDGGSQWETEPLGGGTLYIRKPFTE